jgi:hypothetical protein
MDIYKTINFPLNIYLNISLVIWVFVCIVTIKMNIKRAKDKNDKFLQKEYIVDTIIGIIVYSFITFINGLFIIQLNKYSITPIFKLILFIWCLPWFGLLSIGMQKLYQLLNWSCNNCYKPKSFLTSSFHIPSLWRGTQLKHTILSILGIRTF